MEFQDKLQGAIETCEVKLILRDEGDFYHIYPFATENISGYIPFFELKDKSLLTVGSSADQIISAALYGCTDITVIDLCPFSEDYFYLKASSLENLSRNEFLDYLTSSFQKEFYYEYFIRVAKYLQIINYDSYLLWNNLYQKFSGKVIRDTMFLRDEDHVSILLQSIPYLMSDDAYDQARENIRNIKPKFIVGDIFKEEITEEFDNVWLSNIGGIIPTIEPMAELINKKLINILKKDGRILISYLYEPPKYFSYNQELSEIYNMEKVFDTFPNKIKVESFPSIKKLGLKYWNTNDAVIMYQK